MRVFVIRRAKLEDLATFLKLARMVHFVNLPPDKDILASKIIHSRNCFTKAGGGQGKLEPVPDLPKVKVPIRPTGHARPGGTLALGRTLNDSDLFVFSLEDLESSSVLGTSQIIARMGGPGNPNLSFKLERREFFSESLQFGTTHTVARLHLDETGPTELGGLIIQPSARSHKQRLGRLLSFVRFHFIALHRRHFSDRLLAEMMAPISADGTNVLWEYLGRRFINLNYIEADRFCQYSREFMTSLLPREEIYLTLLPPEARAVIGQVGPETVPARRLLEKLGFRYKDFIDPFDGGPHLEARTSDVPLVKVTRALTLGAPIAHGSCPTSGIVSHMPPDGEFAAVEAEFHADGKSVRVPRAAMEALGVEPGSQVGVTPLESLKKSGTAASGSRRGRRAVTR